MLALTGNWAVEIDNVNDERLKGACPGMEIFNSAFATSAWTRGVISISGELTEGRAYG
jgi:hypothetical protein